MHIAPRSSARRRNIAGVLASVAAAALILAGTTVPTMTPAAAAPAGLPADALPAVFAEGGSSSYRDTIQWLQWADYDTQFAGQDRPNVPVLDYGETKPFINYRDMGDAGYLVTTCTLSDLQHLGHRADMPDDLAQGPLVATRPGTWAGDVLDNLYNIGGAADWSDGSEVWHSGLVYPRDYRNNNQMVIGLANGYAYNGDKTWDGKDKNDPTADRTPTGGYSRISFDMSCSAEMVSADGTTTPVALHGLVFADAEASNPPVDPLDPLDGEWIQASVPDGENVTWRLLDGMRSERCTDTRAGKTTPVTTVGTLSNNNQTLRLDNSGLECVYQDGGRYSQPNGLGGPAVSVFMEGTTRATITMQGSGYSAVALGLIIATDYGDAPETYGSASALIQPSWEGGEITPANSSDLFDSSVIERTRMSVSGPRLGTLVDSEGHQFYSTGADGDDQNGPDDPVVDDEDGVSLPDGGYNTAPGAVVTQAVTCQGQGTIAGWVDWNHNGQFDDAEKSDEQPCAGGSATLSWTVPNDVVRSVDGETGSQPDTYLRVRISNDGKPLHPTGVTMSGEVEDYKLSVRVPTLELVKEVDAPHATTEVPGLDAAQWTLQAKNGSASEAPGLISGSGSTPVTVALPADYALSESSDAPEASGYEAGQWSCTETPGTVNAPGVDYSSAVAGSTLTIANQDRVTCRIVNTSKPATLTWDKVDQDGSTPLGGTSWTLTGPGVAAGTVVEDCTSSPCASTPLADTDPAPGAFTVTGLNWGVHTITEHTVPAGYELLGQSLCFDLAAPGAGPKNVDWTAYPQCQAPASDAQTSLEVGLQPVTDVVTHGAVTNVRVPGSVAWTKVDEGGARLTGSVWTLTGPADTGVAATIEDCVAASADQCTAPAGSEYFDSDPAGGQFKVTGLPWSTEDYTLVESKAPAGYRVETTPHPFSIRADALDYVFANPFTNTKGGVPGIPLTGGRGAHLFLIAGGVLLSAALAAGLIRRYRSRKH